MRSPYVGARSYRYLAMLPVRGFAPPRPILRNVVSPPRNRRSNRRPTTAVDTTRARTRGHKGTRGHQRTIQQTNHCTSLSSALGQRLQTWHAVAMQCGVGLLVYLLLALPLTAKVATLAFLPSGGPQRWGDGRIAPTLPLSGHGVRYVAPPRWLPPTHPRTRIRRGVQLRGGNAEQQGEAHPE